MGRLVNIQSSSNANTSTSKSVGKSIGRPVVKSIGKVSGKSKLQIDTLGVVGILCTFSLFCACPIFTDVIT